MHQTWRHFVGLMLVGSTALVAASADGPISLVRGGLPHDALYDIAFLDRAGVAVGHHGAILSSSNGGVDWTTGAAPTELALTAVALSSAGTVIVGQQGSIFVGPPGGDYNKVDSPTAERLMSVALHESGLAVAVGGFGTVLVSEDAGHTWLQIDMDWSEFNDEGLEAHLYDADISPTGTILICGEFGLVLRSIDRGRTWAAMHKGAASLFAMHLDSDGRGLAVGQNGVVLRTEDGGSSWSPVPLDTQSNLLDVWASAEDEAVIVGMRTLARSSDAGNTWTLMEGRTVERSWYQALASSHVIERLAENGSVRKEQVYAVGQAGNIVTVNR